MGGGEDRGGVSFYVRPSRYSAASNTSREIDMPEIYVHAVKGRTLDQKRALVKDITDAVVKNFAVPVEAVTVEIVESEPTVSRHHRRPFRPAGPGETLARRWVRLT